MLHMAITKEDTNKPPKPIERILVAVPDFNGNATIISYQGKCIYYDIDAVGSGIDDIGLAPPDESGLWIWEGIPIWRSTTDYEGNEDGEMDYDGGVWRRPTPEELEKIQKCESIWPSTFFCMECGHEQQNKEPCEVCDSVIIISTKTIEEHFGPNWREVAGLENFTSTSHRIIGIKK